MCTIETFVLQFLKEIQIIYISNSKRYINLQDIQLLCQPEAVNPLIKLMEANVLHNSITV